MGQEGDAAGVPFRPMQLYVASPHMSVAVQAMRGVERRELQKDLRRLGLVVVAGR